MSPLSTTSSLCQGWVGVGVVENTVVTVLMTFTGILIMLLIMTIAAEEDLWSPPERRGASSGMGKKERDGEERMVNCR